MTRVQPYRFIHKALRTLMMQTLHRCGTLDPADTAERAQLVDQVDELLAVLADHVAHENRFFHEPLRERAPALAAVFDGEHRHHLEAIDALRRDLRSLRQAEDDAAAQAYTLYLALSRFVAENLVHMAEEETTLTRALWRHFGDAEILAMEGALVASLSPAENEFALRWMARGLNLSELQSLLHGARAAMPAEAFTAALGLVRTELDTARVQRLDERLGAALA